MKIKIYFLAFSALLLFACNQNNTSSDQYKRQAEMPQDTLQPMTSVMDSLVKKGGGPCLTGSDCMEIIVHWPIVLDGDEAVRKIINDSINKFVLENLEYNPDFGAINLTQLADTLISYYAIEYSANKAYDTGWSMEVNGEIEFHDGIGILQIFNYSFMGGAHPNHFAQYTNFNTRTGKIIQYADFVVDTLAFKKLVETRFLNEATEKAEDNVTIEEFFWGDGFQLPINFALGKDNLELLYNPYEAAAYVFGEFELVFTYEELEGVIDLGLINK
jgi:uncharacterized protein DUF3298